MSSLLENGRSHDCGALRHADVGATVVLFGWVHRRRDHGALIFINLRDRFGITQVVIDPDLAPAAHAAAAVLRGEFCIAVAGVVVSRGDNINAQMPTGEIEVSLRELEVFSSADVLPFNVADDAELDATETHRLKYRYLDLRRPSLQKNFVLRSRLATLTRLTLAEAGFLELETPYMVKYTPWRRAQFLGAVSRVQRGTSSSPWPRARRSSSSSSWSRASTSTSRSAAASATRICATIASPSSPRSTSR